MTAARRSQLTSSAPWSAAASSSWRAGARSPTVSRTRCGRIRPCWPPMRGSDMTSEPLTTASRLVARGLVAGYLRGVDILRGASVEAPRGQGRRVDELVSRACEQFPVLRDRCRQPAGTLSGGQQRQLEIARSLMHDPVLIIDEPTAGVEPRVAAVIYETIKSLAAQGKAVLLVDQNIKRALEIADVLRADCGLEWHRAVAPGVEVGENTTHGLALSRVKYGFESRWGLEPRVERVVEGYGETRGDSVRRIAVAT